jgi:hypothetical protein
MIDGAAMLFPWRRKGKGRGSHHAPLKTETKQAKKKKARRKERSTSERGAAKKMVEKVDRWVTSTPLYS